MKGGGEEHDGGSGGVGSENMTGGAGEWVVRNRTRRGEGGHEEQNEGGCGGGDWENKKKGGHRGRGIEQGRGGGRKEVTAVSQEQRFRRSY